MRMDVIPCRSLLLKRNITILFSSAGRRVELIRCFRQAAEALEVVCRIVAVDLAPEWSPACQIVDAAFSVPRCSSVEFLPAIREICQREQVQLIVPTIDPELPVYAKHAAAFAAAGTRVLTPEAAFVTLAGDKFETVRFLQRCNIAAPQTWLVEDSIDLPTVVYPLIAKPRQGSASRGVHRLEHPKALRQFLDTLCTSDKGEYVLQTLCAGRELTVHAFYRAGKLVCTVPHYRKFVRAGEVCFAETVACPAAQAAAEGMASGFAGLSGVICFQGFANEDSFQVTEINARFGGGYPLADAAGGRFARWLIQESLGMEPEGTPEVQVGLRMLRYDAAVFVPPLAGNIVYNQETACEIVQAVTESYRALFGKFEEKMHELKEPRE